jgi:transposase
MSYIEGISRNQRMLFPDAVDEYIDEDNPVRFIDVFVDRLDLKELGFTHAEVEPTGRPPYDPADLLKLYIYGYLNRTRTTRKLEAESRRNVEVMWLLRKLTPDFKTIADFRRDNKQTIKKVFKEFVFLCKRLNLFSGELVAIDGCKIKAVNSKKRNFNRKKLKRSIKYIEEQIDEYLCELDKNDAEEKENALKSSNDLKEKISILKDRKKDYLKLLKELEDSGENQISLTDSESRLMINNQSADICYNVQVSTDEKHKLIIDYEVTNEVTDLKQLSTMSKRARDILGLERIEVTADKGYYDSSELKECIDKGIVPYVPERSPNVTKKGDVPKPDFYRDKFIYDAKKDVYICPCGKELPFRKKVIKDGKVMKAYRSSYCRYCVSNKECTKNPEGRIIFRWIYEEILDDMRERINKEKWKVKIRQCLIEHVFGTIKRNFNQEYFLTRGKDNVSGEMGLTALAYNMRRVLNIIGAKRLITIAKAIEKRSIFVYVVKKLEFMSFCWLKVKYSRINYV